MVPSWWDPVVATASRAIGGPAGRYLAIGSRGLAGVAAALIAMSGLMIALGVFQKGHCVVKGWVNPDQFWRACYSDIPVVHLTTGLAQGNLPWSGATPSDQPLLSGLVMWVVSRISPENGTDVASQRWVFTTWAFLAVVMLAAGVLAGVAMRPRRPWQVAHLALSPVLAVLALISTDLVAVALTMWGLWAWYRSRPATAGVMLGIAFLARPYPLVFLAAMVLVGWRDDRRRAALTALISAALAALAIYLPFAIAMPQVGAAVRSWAGAGPGYGALAMVPTLVGAPMPASWATSLAILGWVAALLAGGWLTFTSALRPSMLQISAVMMLVVVLTAKSVSVQTGLWLLPLLALSALPWRDHLLWAAAEIVHFEAVWLHIGFGTDAGKGLPPSAYAVALAIRLMAWSWICWRVWDTPLPDDDPAPVAATWADPERELTRSLARS